MNYSTYIKKLKQLLDKQSQKLCAAKDKEKFLFEIIIICLLGSGGSESIFTNAPVLTSLETNSSMVHETPKFNLVSSINKSILSISIVGFNSTEFILKKLSKYILEILCFSNKVSDDNLAKSLNVLIFLYSENSGPETNIS